MAMTDPSFTDPRLGDPVLPGGNDTGGGKWGWIAGVAVLALIAFLVIAGVSHNTNTASNNPAPLTTGSTPMRNVTPPSTTGSGSSSPQPLTPSPNRNGTQ
jgi:hypothetical protein